MIAKELISRALIPLKTSDTGRTALTVMGDFYVRHLPIVNNEQLLGLITEEDILNNPIDEPLGSYKLSLNRPFVTETQHLFEVMGLMNENSLTVIPVIDADENYSGLITQDHLISSFAAGFSFAERGSILVIEMNRSDYSMSELARLVESENASIIACFLTTNPDTARITLTIKIDKQEIQPIIRLFERFNIDVRASFTEEIFNEGFRDRFDQFMNYLNI